MQKLQFVLEGGLGNQLFQYFASKYISKNVPDIDLSYALSDHILKGYRNFELNKLIKEPIKINRQFNQFSEKIYKKIIQYLPILSIAQKVKLKSRIDLLNRLYNEKNYDSFENSLSILAKDLYTLNKSFYKLKIKGFWQNPNCYIDNLDYYRDLLIDTRQLINKIEIPKKYISIHIRRGDYLLNKNLFNTYYTNFSQVEFVLLALNLLPEENDNIPIYLISDDQEWANDLLVLLSAKARHRFFTIDSKDHFLHWAILRHSLINISSNSTFSYTAALLNYENLDQKLRCIVPQWFSKEKSAFEKGWLSPTGFIEI